jgi:hypothetical protein
VSARRLAALTAGEPLAGPAPNPGAWGGWLADFRAGVLRYAAEDYTVDLDECLTAAAVLGVILRVADEPWAEPGALAGFVRLIDEVTVARGTVCEGFDFSPGWWRCWSPGEGEARSWN